MTTLLIEDPVFEAHKVPQGHPERPERLAAIREALADETFAGLRREGAIAASDEQLLLAHPAGHLDKIRRTARSDVMNPLDPDTWAGPDTHKVSVAAAGSACRAVDAVMGGEAANAFIAARPPGHHAESEQAMGFCFFANAVIAARWAQTQHGAKRVAIVDWDVHHGNGTQALVWDDPSILYASTHQMPLFPGTGASNETGAGNVFNAPLGAGAGSTEFREVFESIIATAVRAFAPNLIVISAGFDAHWRDPLGGLEFTTEDFGWATRRLMDIANDCCHGRIVSLLEGGYDLNGLADSVSAHVAALMAHQPSE